MARIHADLVEWLDDKGYGFAREHGGTERIFVHVKNLAENAPRPKKGDELDLEVVSGRKGPAARDVRILGAAEIAKILPYHLVTAIMLLLLVQLTVVMGRAPFGLSVYYVVMGGASLYLYSRDKQAALFGWWRISERRLLTVDLLGGIIGGLLAQHRYRHKKSKQSYQVKVFAIVVVHAIFLALLGSGVLVQDNFIAAAKLLSSWF